LGILFSSILCTCPNQRNLFNLIHHHHHHHHLLYSINPSLCTDTIGCGTCHGCIMVVYTI
jgi:hypothetical protein